MKTHKEKTLKISNVYLYKDNQLELIKELENVFIRGIFTCGHSINILLDPKDGVTHNNTFIKLDNQTSNGTCSSGKSYLNISHKGANDSEFLTKDFVLYTFENRKSKSASGGASHNGEIATSCENLTNNNSSKVLQRREIKNKLVNNGRNSMWHFTLPNSNYISNEEMANISPIIDAQNYAKCLPQNTKKIFLGEYQFYGIDEEKKILTWHTDVHTKDKIIYNYHTKFVTYINLFEKIKVVDISCGQSHTLFLTQCKNCYAMGSNDNYQISSEKINNNKICFYSTPQLIRLDKDVVKKVKCISAGYSHNIICTYRNEVYGWGNNLHGQLFLNKQFVKSPTLILNPNIWTNLMIKKRKLKKEILKNNFARATSQIGNDTECKCKEEINNYIFSSSLSPFSINEQKKYTVEPMKRDKLWNVKLIKCIDEECDKIKKRKEKKKFQIGKICCGFSFSCLLLKNKNCYVIGKTNVTCPSEAEKINTLVRINKKKYIDDVYCNFFNIILVHNFKIEKIIPRIIHPNSEKTILIYTNLPLKDFLNYRIKLNHRYAHKWENIDAISEKSSDCKNDETSTHVDLYVCYQNETGNGENKHGRTSCDNCRNGKYPGSNRGGDQKLRNKMDIYTHALEEKKEIYCGSYKMKEREMNKQLFLKLYNEKHCIENNQCSIVLSEYKGQVIHLSPNNCALMKNIKLKVKIKKVPISVQPYDIYILYHFTDEYQNEIFKFSKGKLRRGGTYIYTKFPCLRQENFFKSTNQTLTKINSKDIIYTKCDTGNTLEEKYPRGQNPILINTFTKCNVYYSLGYNFYPHSLPITIIKPEILNIVPDFIYIHDKKLIHINMMHLCSNFEFIYVTLSNPTFSIIRKKAHYNSTQGNFFFSSPLIPIGKFKKANLDFIKFHVFVSYNNVEYSQNEIILTISNVSS
ncbi:hypothetical protein, conserved [Plasmodium gonderi]|uniref:Regulator of chromosome condensation n=1 Tax=Plasmodium gonderi TaxID=77519 RepID=A0A1Y1JJ33_PLAGO|nr:hypothetical protein, conserved [Plasmodium gonderi]GAW81197.1 hypothetical protein, conserved [Plasmodium gonderi]